MADRVDVAALSEGPDEATAVQVIAGALVGAVDEVHGVWGPAVAARAALVAFLTLGARVAPPPTVAQWLRQAANQLDARDPTIN